MRTILTSRRLLLIIASVLLVGGLAVGTWRDPDFWFTANQRGERLMKHHEYAKAGAVFSDPWRIGIAQYRQGNFEDAAHTFRRVPGAEGSYDAGNSWLMHGKYEEAISEYDRALEVRPDFQMAKDNKALAIARREAMRRAGKDAAEESEDALPPDKIVFDLKPSDPTSDQQKPPMQATDLSDEQLQATWLRQVKTTPADFLKAKFAWQARQPVPETP